MIKKIYRILKSPRDFVFWLTGRKIMHIVPDRIYIWIKYWSVLGRVPNLKTPKYFSEKLQWMKINVRNDIYPNLVDKYKVREYIRDTIGEKYLIPLIGVWDNPEDIDWDKLPDKFVLKTVNGSHTNIVCKNKAQLDISNAIKKLKKWQRSNQAYYYGREWPYKNVKPRIIAEKYIESETKGGIVDYKFMCFHGKPDHVMLCVDRETGNTKFFHFDRNWHFLKYQYVDLDKPDSFTIPKPAQMDEMFMVAEKLSSPFPFVRVDLYCEKGNIYFGELTFFPQSGFDTDYTDKTDLYFGTLLKVPN